MPTNKSFDLIIFDCDGVLVDSEALAGQVFWDQLASLGWPHDLAKTNTMFVGRSLASCFTIIEEALNIKLPDDFEQQLQSRTYAVFEEKLKAIDGVKDFILDLVAQRIPYCVASSGSHEKMSVTLGITELDALTPHRFSSTQVSKGKPAPDLFLYAAQQMGTAPERCIVIEDSAVGIESALTANMHAIQLHQNGLPQSGDLCKNVLHARNYLEIKKYLAI